MKKEKQALQLEIVEKVSLAHDSPVIFIKKYINNMQATFSVKLIKYIRLEKDSTAIYSLNRLDNSVYMAFTNGVLNNKNSFKMFHNSYTIPINVQEFLTDGFYEFENLESPIFLNGYDWYKLIKSDYEI